MRGMKTLRKMRESENERKRQRISPSRAIKREWK